VLTRIGKYEIIQAIASGGMAMVYLGRVVGEAGFERQVAIKLMHPHIADDPEFVTMFLDEARLAARIHHPNVVATLDVGRSAEGLFLVMEYIEGMSVQALLRNARVGGQAVPIGIALRVFVDLLNGLHAAHELVDAGGATINLVHRDVSPHNVLIGVDGVSRITDFGVAHAEARMGNTRSGQLKGKLGYMSPEQIRSEAIDRRCDIYAAGVVLWETLTTRRLYKSDTDAGLMNMILQGQVAPPSTISPTVGTALDQACMRALSPHAGSRYPTAASFADELEDAARRSGIYVANSRAVAAYMQAQVQDRRSLDDSHDDQALTQHYASGDLPPELRALAEAARQGPVTARHEAIGGSGTGTGVGMTHNAPSVSARRGVMVTVAVACGTLVLVGVLAWLMVAPPPAATPTPAATGGSTPPVRLERVGSDGEITTDPLPEDAEPESDEPEVDEPDPLAEASASASAKPARPPARIHRRSVRRPGPTRRKPSPPPPAGTSFRPSKL
jgi:serine/threonine-protein kinase